MFEISTAIIHCFIAVVVFTIVSLVDSSSLVVRDFYVPRFPTAGSRILLKCGFLSNQNRKFPKGSSRLKSLADGEKFARLESLQWYKVKIH